MTTTTLGCLRCGRSVPGHLGNHESLQWLKAHQCNLQPWPEGSKTDALWDHARAIKADLGIVDAALNEQHDAGLRRAAEVLLGAAETSVTVGDEPTARLLGKLAATIKGLARSPQPSPTPSNQPEGR